MNHLDIEWYFCANQASPKVVEDHFWDLSILNTHIAENPEFLFEDDVFEKQRAFRINTSAILSIKSRLSHYACHGLSFRVQDLLTGKRPVVLPEWLTFPVDENNISDLKAGLLPNAWDLSLYNLMLCLGLETLRMVAAYDYQKPINLRPAQELYSLFRELDEVDRVLINHRISFTIAGVQEWMIEIFSTTSPEAVIDERQLELLPIRI